jgi:hypothetical protein
MIETITIITLSVLFLIFFRPGKTPPLDNLLIIERPGLYHMTLAPQINLAQPFIEAIAKNIGTLSDTSKHSSTQFFEVRDKQVSAHGFDFYLLAITQCNEMLYFQATSPLTNDRNIYIHTIHKFADVVLNRLHAIGEHDTALDEKIYKATQEIALLRGIYVEFLPH